jgi:hypothetical protein
MQVQAVQNNPSFEGRVIVVGSNSRKILKKFAKEANRMNVVRNSDRNVYLGKYNVPRPIRSHNNSAVAVLALKNPKPENNRHVELYFYGITTVKNSQAVISAVKRAIKAKPMEELEKTEKSCSFKNLWKSIKKVFGGK